MKCVSCLDVDLVLESRTIFIHDDGTETAAGTGYLYCPECGLLYKEVKKSETPVLSGMPGRN